MYNWNDKYRPKSLSQIYGHNKEIEELKMWAERWNNESKDKAVILYGRCGTGKTSSCYALANDMRMETIEINASDSRTASVIKEIVGNSSQMSSLSGFRKLIIIDEADNIHGNADRGGEKELIKIIKNTKYPIILTVNDLHEISKGLQSVCKIIEFKSINVRTIINVLKKIYKKENISISNLAIIEDIANKSNGDLRSAINDLQTFCLNKNINGSNNRINNGIDINRMNRNRDTKGDIFKVLETIFKNRDNKTDENLRKTYEEVINLGEEPSILLKWIDENIGIRCKDTDIIIENYDRLSKASLYLGRVSNRQNYNLWKYASVLMSSVQGSNVSCTNYNYPSVWRKLSMTKEDRRIKESLSKKVWSCYHIKLDNDLLIFFRLIMKNERHRNKIIEDLKLDSGEIKFLI